MKTTFDIVITGGAGFIGSHVVERVAQEYPDARITVLDKMTYAADIENLTHVLNRQRRLVVGDICDLELCARVTRRADFVLHLAAESHVDNSFGNSLRFTQSNAVGSHTLLEACRANKVPRLIHVSTDEVYGETNSGEHTEKDALNPSNPYSASKAAADMIVNSYIHSFNMPVIIVRANNIFGIRQYPEKIIPKFTMLGLMNRKFTLHGNGKHRRRYLAVEDFADAVVLLMQKGKLGEIYNVGSDDELTNLDVAQMIATELNRPAGEMIEFVADRPFNDSRYAVESNKLLTLGWNRKRRLKDKLANIVSWYRENASRYIEIVDNRMVWHGEKP
jgi:UDP-glucose 4,6-dehydratase